MKDMLEEVGYMKKKQLVISIENNQPSPLYPRFECQDLLFVWQDLGMP